MKTILVGTDFSPIATEALRYAGRLAADSGAELIAVYAHPFEPPMEFTSRAVPDVARSIASSRQRAQEELERCVGENVPPAVRTQAVVVEGHPVTAIITQAARLGADTIVVGSHGRTGIQRLLLGSVSARVVAESPVPVVVVPGTVAA